MTTRERAGRVKALALAAMAALFFVWPMPHTIGLRNVLLLACLLLFGTLVARSKGSGLFSGLRVPLMIYLVLTAWLIFIALCISQETSWSLKEIKGQWLKSGLTMLLGLVVATSARAAPILSPANVLMLLVAVLLGHVLYIDASAIYAWIQTGEVPSRMAGLMEHSAYANHVSNMLLVLLSVEAFSRLVLRRSMLPLPAPILALFIAAALGSAFFEQMRNGFVELGALFILLLSLYWYENRARVISARIVSYLAVLVVLAGVFLYQGFRADVRWNTFVQTIPIALDTETNKAWMDTTRYPLPKLPDGTEVSHSNYMRIAWLKAGIEIVTEYPLGIGYGRNAFGHAVQSMYGGRAGSSHSGLLDMAIGAGIPGAILWCGFLSSVGWFAFRRYRADRNFAALTLFLLTVGFSVRMILDATIRDHILEQFLFLVGLFAVWAARTPSPDTASTARPS